MTEGDDEFIFILFKRKKWGHATKRGYINYDINDGVFAEFHETCRANPGAQRNKERFDEFAIWSHRRTKIVYA